MEVFKRKEFLMGEDFYGIFRNCAAFIKLRGFPAPYRLIMLTLRWELRAVWLPKMLWKEFHRNLFPRKCKGGKVEGEAGPRFMLRGAAR